MPFVVDGESKDIDEFWDYLEEERKNRTRRQKFADLLRRWWRKVRDFVGVARTFPRRLTQRYRKGYNYTDLWDFDHYLAGVLEKAFNELADVTHGFPAYLSHGDYWNPTKDETDAGFAEWQRILREIAEGFRIYNEEKPIPFDENGRPIWDQIHTKEEEEAKDRAVKNSLALMAEHFGGFWD